MVSNISRRIAELEWVSENWLVVRSPHPIIYALIAYLYFVLHLGPHLMRNRPPISLNRILVGYNLCQAIFNLWLCLEMLHLIGLPCITTNCCICQLDACEGSRFSLPVLHLLYWISKIVDLMETVFFVLRKKFNQITFLHLYHHVAMVLFVWVYMKYSDDKHSTFIGLANTFVHVIMYSYYLISALGPKYQKLLWWKKYVTWLQLTQFGIIEVYLVVVTLMDCGVSIYLFLWISTNDVIITLLFCNFYRNAYRKNANKSLTKTE